MEPTTINNFTPTEFKDSKNSNRLKYDINLNSIEFETVINELVRDYRIDEIVETGTFNGLGSTSVFAKTGKYVFSIECNKSNYETAVANLRNYDNVCVIHGLSLPRRRLIDFLLFESFKIETTYDSDYPKSFYMREINQQVVVENALDIFCNNNRPQLVFLDSAGGIGYAEFLDFMAYENNFDTQLDHEKGRVINQKYKILVLDDISHIKHKRSVEHLENQGFIVNKSKENRFAWCDLSKGKLKKEKNGEENILSE